MGIGDPDNGHTLVSPALLEGGDRRWAGVKACTVSVRQDTDPKKKKEARKKRTVKRNMDCRNTKREDRTSHIAPANSRKWDSMISDCVQSFVYSKASVAHL